MCILCDINLIKPKNIQYEPSHCLTSSSPEHPPGPSQHDDFFYSTILLVQLQPATLDTRYNWFQRTGIYRLYDFPVKVTGKYFVISYRFMKTEATLYIFFVQLFSRFSDHIGSNNIWNLNSFFCTKPECKDLLGIVNIWIEIDCSHLDLSCAEPSLVTEIKIK